MHGPAVLNYHDHYHCKWFYCKTGTFAGYTVYSLIFVTAFCVQRNVTAVPGTNIRKLPLCVQRSCYFIFFVGISNFVPKFGVGNRLEYPRIASRWETVFHTNIAPVCSNGYNGLICPLRNRCRWTNLALING